MSIWTSKAFVFALTATLTTAACDELPQTSGGGAKAMTQANMSDGAVRLATPQGYCIDPRSLRDRFALIGRCDTLGVSGFFAAWEIAIVTVSTVPVAAGATAPNADTLAATPGAGDLMNSVRRSGLSFVQMRGDTGDVDGVSERHWRTAFVLNDQLISLALYAPSNSDATGAEGARILETVARTTQAATAQVSE